MGTKLSLAAARSAIRAAQQKASEWALAISVTVVDEAGWVIATERMDGGALVCLDVAYKKAYTSALMRLPTRDLSSLC